MDQSTRGSFGEKADITSIPPRILEAMQTANLCQIQSQVMLNIVQLRIR